MCRTGLASARTMGPHATGSIDNSNSDDTRIAHTDESTSPVSGSDDRGDSDGPGEARVSFRDNTNGGNGGVARSGFFGNSTRALQAGCLEHLPPSAAKARTWRDDRLFEDGNDDVDIDLELGYGSNGQ